MNSIGLYIVEGKRQSQNFMKSNLLKVELQSSL